MNDEKQENSDKAPKSIPFILDGEVIAMRLWNGEDYVGFEWGEEAFNDWLENG